jgi:hypothetical protein
MKASVRRAPMGNNPYRVSGVIDAFSCERSSRYVTIRAQHPRMIM